MRIIYFDCSSGISGDMALAALLDLGVDKEFLITELAKLHVDGYELIIQKKDRHSIKMMDVDVRLVSEDRGKQINDGEGQGHHHHQSLERNLDAIIQIINESDIADRAKNISKDIFLEIARAEAKVHDKPIDEVHFHEVGAVDSIVDIVGVSICIAALAPDVIYSSELHDGNGFIQCRHGLLPVPVPAVMAMLEGTGIPLIQEAVRTEMVTPTGMGIIKCLAEKYTTMPPMTIEKTGYGLGKRETGRFGAVRASLGELYDLKIIK